MEPLPIVAATPPVEATIRILLNSVPYLMGAAVVRQPAGPDAIAADVGRNPWLFDRRLTSLQLPDDALPANRAVALDWPVPYQAEWVGIPPRLLISRLVFAGRTVGVFLGTLVTREQLGAQAREAIDLSCELIAATVAMDNPALFVPPPPQISVPEIPEIPEIPAAAQREPIADPAPGVGAAEPAASPEPVAPPEGTDRGSAAIPAPATVADPPDRDEAIVAEVARAVAVAGDARAVARVLRDALNAVVPAAAFAVALFHADRPEVAYRYKVVGVDAASGELGRQPIDDGPQSDAVRGGARWHAFERDLSVGSARRQVAVLQIPLSDGGVPIGVVSMQALRDGGIGQGEVELILKIVEATPAAFAAARAAGRFQPPAAPDVTHPRPDPPAAEPDAPAPACPSGPEAAPADPAAEVPAAAPPPATPSDEILGALLERFASAGAPTAFILGLDVAAGLLRGERASGSPAAAELDAALGITDGRFAVSLDDRYNAIARACREARTITAPTVHELVQPAYEWSDALVLERRVGGGHSAILPIAVGGSVVGVAVVGPGAEAPDVAVIERLQAIVADAALELTGAWRAASIGGAAGQVVANGGTRRRRGLVRARGA